MNYKDIEAVQKHMDYQSVVVDSPTSVDRVLVAAQPRSFSTCYIDGVGFLVTMRLSLRRHRKGGQNV